MKKVYFFPVFLWVILFFGAAAHAQKNGFGSSRSSKSSAVAATRGFGANARTIANVKTYELYMKKGGYIGRTSGQNGSSGNVFGRNRTHHKNGTLGRRSKILLSSTNKDAIRGAEDILIRRQGAKGRTANRIRGISDRNAKKDYYWREALKEFGDKLAW